MNNPSSPPSQPGTPTPAPAIDPIQLENYRQELRAQQNLPFGLLGGVAGLVVSAVIWALVTVALDRQIGYMAIGVGFLVGLGVRLLGKGLDPIFGILGAALSLIGVLAGNILTVVILLSREFGVSVTDVLAQLDLGEVLSALIQGSEVIDWLFYALALYFGYRFSIRQITAKDLAKLSSV
ncbi:MAG TPA: hypothetical protein VJG32_11250 [Anaerolineae bacterium]|nr:hypothetical protein [Anaerolineae bacterium]